MKRFFVLATLVLCVGCDPGPERTTLEAPHPQDGWYCKKCFEKDGYSIYSFYDGDRTRYFVTPTGSVVNDYTVHTGGKNSHIIHVADDTQTVGE